jgi:large-conductance mechanosensitive channel
MKFDLIKLKNGFMPFKTFISTYTVVATIIGYILGILITNAFTAYIDDIFIPLFINTWFPKNVDTLTIFGQPIKFKSAARHTIIFIVSLLLIYFCIGFIHFHQLN